MIYTNQLILDRINAHLKKKRVTNETASAKRLYQKGDLINDTFIRVYDILDKDKEQSTTSIEDLDKLIRKVVKGLAFIKYKNPEATLSFNHDPVKAREGERSHGEGNTLEAKINSFEKEVSNREIEAILITESRQRLSNLIDLTNI